MNKFYFLMSWHSLISFSFNSNSDTQNKRQKNLFCLFSELIKNFAKKETEISLFNFYTIQKLFSLIYILYPGENSFSFFLSRFTQILFIQLFLYINFLRNMENSCFYFVLLLFFSNKMDYSVYIIVVPHSIPLFCLFMKKKFF